jgi:hypothetical protein
MIGRLMRLFGWLAVYTCVATVIAQAIILVSLASRWELNRTRLVQMLAVAQGVDLFAIKAEAEQEQAVASQEQVSLAEIAQTRAVNVRHLELREEALRSGLDQLAYEQRKLTDEKVQYARVREAFDAQLALMQESAIAQGADNVRLKLEAIKAKQAKELLLEMLDDEELNQVVVLLAAMPTSKCAKIMAEFRTAEEITQLNEILRKIREGYPEFDLADGTLAALDRTARTDRGGFLR